MIYTDIDDCIEPKRVDVNVHSYPLPNAESLLLTLQIENEQLRNTLTKVEGQLTDVLRHFTLQQENEGLRRELTRLKELLP